MYVCSCKDLTEEDVQDIARAFAANGPPAIADFLTVLNLDDARVCGLCLQASEQFIDIALAVWQEMRVDLVDAREVE